MKKLLFLMVFLGFIMTLLGSCGKSDDAATATTLSAPSNVSAAIGWHMVFVNWTAVSGASSYTVYWVSIDNSTLSTSSGTITGITDDYYLHTGLDNGTTYYYKVATVNSAGTGSHSSVYSATPRTGPTVTEACTFGEAASGTVSGLKGDNASDILTGTFYHSWNGQEPSDGCIDNSSALSAFSQIVASDSVGVKHARIIQGNGNAMMDSWHFYTGPGCTKQSGFISYYYDNVTVGDNITIANNDASGYPKEATKVLYKNNYICVLAETASVETTLETLFQGGLSLTVGTVFDSPNGTVGSMDNNTVLWTVLDNISSTTLNYFYTEDNEIEITYPDNFTDDGATVWHAGDNITR